MYMLITARGVGVYQLCQVYRYMYVPLQRVWFLSRFGLKTGIDFEHFGLKLGMVIGILGDPGAASNKVAAPGYPRMGYRGNIHKIL